MAISRKGRRKCIRHECTFYWLVKEDEEAEGQVYLFLYAEDKTLMVRYRLGQTKQTPSRRPVIIVEKGKIKGQKDMGRWRRYLVPEWEDTIGTPALVAEIVDWCFQEEAVTEVDWRHIEVTQSIDQTREEPNLKKRVARK